MRLTEISVGRRVATAAIALALLVLGAYSFTRLPVDFLPSISYPMVKVHIWWRGATPEEIDRSLADPIERQMATVDDLDYIESSSIEGMYTLLVNFRYGVDINVAYQDCLAAMARVARVLPADIEPPVIIKADPSQLPVAQLTVGHADWDPVRLRSWTEEWLQDQLQAVSGVAGSEIVGGLEREIRILLDPPALEKYGLSLPAVSTRLQAENIDQFAGRVTAGPQEFIARTRGEFASLEEIRNLVIDDRGAAPVRLGDLATVVDGHQQERVITRLDQGACVKLSVLKQSSANTVEVAEGVSVRLAKLAPDLPEGLEIGMVENQAEYVTAAINGVRNAAMVAAVMIVLVIWLFLGSWRQVSVVALALPATLIINFGLMQWGGFSLNIFSLGGLVVAISVLLDNSIVIIEAISLRRKEVPSEPVAEACIRASSALAPAIIAATASFLALFLPFLLVPGLVSLLFRELILVIAGIVVISLTVALTLTPTLSAVLLGRETRTQGPSRFQRGFDRIAVGYGRLLSGVLRWRWPVMVAFVVALAVSLPLIGSLGSEFLPKMDDGRIMIKARLPTGASVAETDAVLRRVEEVLRDEPAVASMFTLVGGKVWGLYTYEIANEGEVDLQLLPPDQRDESTKQFLARIRRSIAPIAVPGGKLMAMQMKLKGIRKLGDADIEIKVRGPDLDGIFADARTVAASMRGLPQFTNVMVSMDPSKPEYEIRIDRARAAEMGLQVADIAGSLRTLVSGAVATRYRDGNDYYDIRLLVDEATLSGRGDLAELPISTRDGRNVRLHEVAEVLPGTGPVEIVREDQIKQVIVRGDAIAGVSIGEARAALQDALAAEPPPLGYERRFGGQAQMMDDMQANLLAVLAFAIFFAFITLAVQFNRLRLPLMILISVPFFLPGAIAGLGLAGLPIGATVVIGVLVVMYATVNDGVLLYTYANELHAEGMSRRVAIIASATRRLRPRLMTTSGALVGFLPLALAFEDGGDLLRPMAVAAVGGLSMEMLVSMLLMPCLYVFGDKRRPVTHGEASEPDREKDEGLSFVST